MIKWLKKKHILHDFGDQQPITVGGDIYANYLNNSYEPQANKLIYAYQCKHCQAIKFFGYIKSRWLHDN